jgi:hypothetical protein
MQDKRDEIHDMILATLARIAALGPMLKGTVCEVKRGAKKRGAGERTAYLLTYKGKGNKTKSVYVPAHRVTEVQDMIARHREATGTLDRIVELSVSLFRAK